MLCCKVCCGACRVEAVIRENFMLQAYDIIELFLELISVRVALMEKSKDMPADMSEAICSIIYAGERGAVFLTGSCSRLHPVPPYRLPCTTVPPTWQATPWHHPPARPACRRPHEH